MLFEFNDRKRLTFSNNLQGETMSKFFKDDIKTIQ